jgi:hypothetical protein
MKTLSDARKSLYEANASTIQAAARGLVSLGVDPRTHVIVIAGEHCDIGARIFWVDHDQTGPRPLGLGKLLDRPGGHTRGAQDPRDGLSENLRWPRRTVP